MHRSIIIVNAISDCYYYDKLLLKCVWVCVLQIVKATSTEWLNCISTDGKIF